MFAYFLVAAVLPTIIVGYVVVPCIDKLFKIYILRL